jgi:hypothetical protein
MMNDKRANEIYKKLFKEIIVPLIGNKTTYQNELDIAGKKLFNSKYAGTFASDEIPKLNNKKKYIILNLDKSNEPGSHWVAVAFHKNKYYFFDSFGRNSKKILPALYKGKGKNKIIDTDNDKDQKESETNCGAKSLTFLLLFDNYGPEAAMYI